MGTGKVHLRVREVVLDYHLKGSVYTRYNVGPRNEVQGPCYPRAAVNTHSHSACLLANNCKQRRARGSTSISTIFASSPEPLLHSSQQGGSKPKEIITSVVSG